MLYDLLGQVTNAVKHWNYGTQVESNRLEQE